ncbi:MAG TPA: hypothetical protein VKZ50_14005 [bacterium]|nr:hypothetical protein [bacterium]
MPDTLTQTLQTWHDFYLLVGTAAATLVGLMFLATALGSQLLNRETIPALGVFLTPTVIHFVYVLIIATVALTPILTRVPLGVLLVLAGLLSFGQALSGVRYMRRQQREGRLDQSDWIWYLITPVVSYLLLIGTGIGLLSRNSQALSALALATVVLLVLGIRNAWDMVVFFAVKTEPPHG